MGRPGEKTRAQSSARRSCSSPPRRRTQKTRKRAACRSFEGGRGGALRPPALGEALPPWRRLAVRRRGLEGQQQEQEQEQEQQEQQEQQQEQQQRMGSAPGIHKKPVQGNHHHHHHAHHHCLLCYFRLWVRTGEQQRAELVPASAPASDPACAAVLPCHPHLQQPEGQQLRVQQLVLCYPQEYCQAQWWAADEGCACKGKHLQSGSPWAC